MRRLVLDEWLWADLRGENQREAQRESFWLLQKVFDQCDQLVTVDGSPFLQKFYDLCEEASTGDPRRAIVRTFRDQFLYNSEKLHRLQESDLPEVPREIEGNIKDDDKYLVRAYLAAGAELLVTTDEQLMEALNNCGIRCRDRKSVISDYVREQGHK